ncbi:hypothetical protein AVEN_135044-1 [Araneus ventricosus]|uniref:Uncharacterized protein n=1 Tax=Araneus ventricosus TaxID=182803 RepID=A0A4Y2CXW5_ARAVE|nr:hypothetical protein AVEN_135044-1 [Araneus ventricosus]
MFIVWSYLGSLGHKSKTDPINFPAFLTEKLEYASLAVHVSAFLSNFIFFANPPIGSHLERLRLLANNAADGRLYLLANNAADGRLYLLTNERGGPKV